MPKKKTGARKKAEKQKQRQKEIKAASESKSIVLNPCNTLMVRSFAANCRFSSALTLVLRLPIGM